MDEIKEIEEFDKYDSGLLNNYGCEVTSWWDYLRAEVGRANEKGKNQYETLLSRIRKLYLNEKVNGLMLNRLDNKEARIKELEGELRKKCIEDIRFWSKIEIKNSANCWNWKSTLNNKGYGRYWNGQLSKNGKKVMTYAHRMVYEKIIGKIPEGMTLDHLCRNPKCVNPSHLEPIPMKENILRGIGLTATNARKTICEKGHPLVKSPYKSHHGGRICPICIKANRKRWKDNHKLVEKIEKRPMSGVYEE